MRRRWKRIGARTPDIANSYGLRPQIPICTCKHSIEFALGLTDDR